MPKEIPRLAILARRLLAAIGGIGQAIKEQTEAITEPIEAQKPENKVPARMIAEVHISDAIETRKNANDARNEQRYQRLALLVSTLTLFAVIIYAWISYRQWREMIGATDAATSAVHEARLNRQQSQKSIDAAINQFRLDQRAWLGLSDPVLLFTATDPYQVTITLKNVGKTPAVHVNSIVGVTEKPKRSEIDFKDLKYAGKPSASGTLFPSASTNIGKSTDKVLPGQDTDIARWKRGDSVVYVFGQVTYSDVFNRIHWTHFCGEMQPDLKNVHICKIYNDTDDTDSHKNPN